MEFLQLIEDIKPDLEYIRWFQEGNQLSLKETIGIRDELEIYMSDYFSIHGMIPKNLLCKYKTLNVIIDDLDAYYIKNDLPKDYSVYSKKI